MNQSKSFTRKVVYIFLIGCLLIPLSFVSRPATRDRTNKVTDEGGVLSAMRDKEKLSQARLSEIDPGSETMKLASLGLRGVAVNLLWLKAIDAKEKKEWDTFSSTLNSLVKIQPNFIRVWEFQGHNLSYNVSVEFDDYEQRYEWIKKGISFLTKGIPYNRRDHRIVDSLGFFCGNKFGTADERTLYRRLFRKDDVFHDEMDSFVNIDRIDTPYGPDHWLLAYEWYDRSITMVDTGIDEIGPVTRHRKEMLFYQNKPAQKRNLGLALHSEFRSDEFAKKNWRESHEEWVDYGNRPLNAVGDIDVTLESLTDSLINIQRYRKQIDELAPGKRAELLAQKLSQFEPEDQELLNLPIDALTDEELEKVRYMDNMLYGGDSGVDRVLVEELSPDLRPQGFEILELISKETIKIKMGEYFRGPVNYDHWRAQTLAESTDQGIAARQAEFDANQLRDRSIFDQYVERDPISSEQRQMPGAMQVYEKAFETWDGILKETPRLEDGPLFDDIVDVIEDYRIVREAAGFDSWPENFILQPVIDRRALLPNTNDELPTSDMITQKLEADQRDFRFRMPKRPYLDFKLESDEKDDANE